MSEIAKKLLSPAEAREILGIGKNRMYEILATDKTFPAFKLNSTWFINADKLQDWINYQTNKR